MEGDFSRKRKKTRRAGLHQEHAGVCHVAATGVSADDVIAGGVVVLGKAKGHNTVLMAQAPPRGTPQLTRDIWRQA